MLHYAAFALVLAAAALDRHGHQHKPGHCLAVSETRLVEDYSPLVIHSVYVRAVAGTCNM